MEEEIRISPYLIEMAEEVEKEIQPYFEKQEKVYKYNCKKVLNAFIKNRVCYQDFEEINGYGFYDGGRDKLEHVFADIFGAEDALVRTQIMSGTNALWLALSGVLHYGDTMLSVSGLPYDSLQGIIGLIGNSKHALLNNGIKYEQIDLLPDNSFDLEKIGSRLKKGGVKLVEIQRSRGYSHRCGLLISQIEEVCSLIKSIDDKIIILVDNCYGEMVEEKEPTEVGADIVAGSLMHNMGGGVSTSGGYIAGKHDLIIEIADRLTAPNIEGELGANYNQHNKYFKGLYMSPQAVFNAIKIAIFTSRMAEKLGFENVSPKYNAHRTDIVQCFDLKTADKLVAFCQGVQMGSPIDSQFMPVPSEFPGYPHEEVMASGTFTQGSTIELTCDAPMIEPYTIYMQGGIAFEYSKIGVLSGFNNLLMKN